MGLRVIDKSPVHSRDDIIDKVLETVDVTSLPLCPHRAGFDALRQSMALQVECI